MFYDLNIPFIFFSGGGEASERAELFSGGGAEPHLAPLVPCLLAVYEK